MKVSREEVLHVAELSQLNLEEAEVEQFQEQLSQIIDWQEKMNQLDLKGLDPMIHVQDMKNVSREDQEVPSLTKDETFKNAPAVEGDYFKVPRIIE